MLLSGLAILTIATIATFWPWVNAYGYKRLLPFPIQLFTTWDGPDDLLIQTGQYYADRNELAAWERRRLASLARKWYLTADGSIREAYLPVLHDLTDDKEAVIEELLNALPTVTEYRIRQVIDVIWALSPDRPATIRRIVQTAFEKAKSGESEQARFYLEWFGTDSLRLRDYADTYLEALVGFPKIDEKVELTLGYQLQKAEYPMSSGLQVLAEQGNGESRIRGLDILEQMERLSRLKQGLRPSDIATLMRIAHTGDTEQAVRVALFIHSLKSQAPDVDRAELVRAALETGSELEKLAALGVLSRCVGRGPIPGYTRPVLDRLISAPDEHAVEFSRTILRQTPSLERPLVVAALPRATPQVQLVLIDAISNWSPADTSGIDAIRGILRQPETVADVRDAAYNALSRMNALNPDESLPYMPWRSP